MNLISVKQLSKENNNFNLMRLLFAFLVIFSHSYSFLGQHEPVIFGRSVGNFSVHAFFVVSGYLITASWLNPKGSILTFTGNRFLRIAPGLAVSIIICNYINILFDSFKNNPIPYIINGPIWTLTWEVICYIAVLLLGLSYILNKKTFPLFAVITYLIYLLNHNNTSEFYLAIVPFILFFMMGAFIYIMMDRINLYKIFIPSLIILLLCINGAIAQKIITTIKSNVVFLYGPVVSDDFIIQSLYILSLPFFLIYVGLHLNLNLKIRTDISYGVYIYGWPISQIIVYYSIKYNIALTPTTLTFTTLLITIPVAYLSWTLIESPCLKLKGLPFTKSKIMKKSP